MAVNILKNLYVRFVHRHGAARHFRSLAIWDAFRSDVTATEMPSALSQRAAGPNEIGLDKPVPWWLHLWHCYSNSFNLLLTLLSAVSYWAEDTRATVVIGSMVLLSTLMRFVQETRSNKAADELKAMVSNKITVLRIPFVQSLASWPLLCTTLVVMATGVFFVMGPCAPYFKLQAPSARIFLAEIKTR